MTGQTNFIASAFLAIVIFGGYGFINPAFAAGKLTKDNVREFIEKTSVITSGRESNMSENEIDDYLNKHITDDARFKSTMRYTIPGFDTQETKMTVDKKDFIENVNKGTEAVSDYESQVQILEMTISKDGRTARVKTRSREKAIMPIENATEAQDVPMEGISVCTQILTMSDEGYIQMYHANCETDIEFDAFAPD